MGKEKTVYRFREYGNNVKKDLGKDISIEKIM
jgi:hypothetical protein